jgi:uncharacterized glyoxalase superfamily protein PhnB
MPSKKTRKSRPGKKSARKRTLRVAPVPARYGTATAHLIVSPCADALKFYAAAFGARITSTVPGPGGILMHAEMKIGDSMIMLADEMPPMPGRPANRKTPKSAGATTGGVMLYVKDVDALFSRAVSAGATAVMPPSDMFWGDRYGQVEDPFGHVWAVATHIKDVSPRALREAMAQTGPPTA